MTSVSHLASEPTLDASRGSQIARQVAVSPRSPFRLGYLVSHPIQYQAPMLRHIAQDPEIDLTVFYMSDRGVSGFDDREFKVQVKWDVPLLGGYRHIFLKHLGGSAVSPLLRPLVVGLEAAFRGAKLDALWLHGYKHQVQLRAIRTARKLHIPILVRGESSGLGNGLGKRISARVVERLFRMIDGFLYIGMRNRRFYSDRGVSDAQLFPVPYAVDNSHFQNAIRRAALSRDELRGSLGIGGAAPVILFAGKLVPRKRPRDLLMAYERVARTFAPDSEPYLVFVGEGEERRHLEHRVIESQLSRVRFAGFINQTEMPRYYDLGDVFVLPSQQEPWGLAVNEAMNAAKPVIVSDRVGCAQDVVRAGQNGFVVPAGDVDGLASALLRLVRDRELRAAMGRQSLHIVSEFSFEQDLRGLKQALHHVCKSRTGLTHKTAV